MKLKLHHDWSDRKMAEELAVSRELVAKTRRMLLEGKQIPNNPGRVGADGKMYTTAGLPKDPHERLPKGKAIAQEDPRDRGAREADPAPWEETGTSRTVGGAVGGAVGSSVGGSPDKRMALSEPVVPSAPTIDEMLGLMTKQIMEVINWTQADGFNDAYRAGSANARGLFQTAVLKLAARAGELRKS